MTDIFAARPGDLASLAATIEPLISPAVALNSGRMTSADALDLVGSGRAQLWLAADGRDLLGAAIGYPVQYTRRKALCMLYIAGAERERWEAPMLEAIERGARHIGCDLVEGIGRRGFSRVLPGYRVNGYSFEKDLTA